MIWPAEDLWMALSAQLPGITVEILPEIDSTNTELMRRARAGQHDPVLLVAERQSAGRGRLGRQWFAEPGQALTFSLGLPLTMRDWSGLSLAVGLSLVDSLDPSGEQGLHLKWPNDLWLALPPSEGEPAWGKLAGVLIETAVTPGQDGARHGVIGVGINLQAPPAEGLRTAPVGWQSVQPAATAATVLQQVAAPLLRDVLTFARQGFAPLQEAFNARDALRDTPVRLSDGVEGQACGVDAQGGLRVRTAQGMQTIASSEVSVRPRTS